MNKDQEFYIIRGYNPLVDAELAELKLSNRHYANIIRTVFGRQKSVYGPMTDEEGLPVSLGRYFYNKCYVPTGITQGITKRGAPVTHDSLVEEVASHTQGINANKTIFLLGEVGVGKTALVNAMLTHYLIPHVEQQRVWFLRTDMEVKEDRYRELLFREDFFLSHLANKAVRVLRRYPQLWERSSELQRQIESVLSAIEGLPLADANNLPDPNYVKRRTLFENLLSLMEETGRRLILFVDNLDYVCHIHDRAMFYDDNGGEGSETLSMVAEFINSFRRERGLGHLGLNVVFVTRLDSYNVLRCSPQWSHAEDRLHYVVTVHPPNWEEALQNRIRLLGQAEMYLERTLPEERHSEIDGIRVDFATYVDQLEKDLQFKPSAKEFSLIAHLRELTNHGLRDLMTFFGEYSFLSHERAVDHGDAMSRFTQQYPVGLIAFMLNNRVFYSQFTAKFPNVYLARCLNLTSNPLGEIHPTCYWLKRLILELLDKNHGFTGPDLVRVFAGRCGEGYSENVVRECLGSVCDANDSNLVRVIRRNADGNLEGLLKIVSMHLTPRGEHLVRTGFLDRFFYLQLIVTDPFLPIPRIVGEYYSDPDELDYGYLVYPDEMYSRAAKQMVKLRAVQVSIFVEVLDITLRLERHYCPKVFETLERFGVEIPSVDIIRTSVRDDLGRLDRVYHNDLKLKETYALCENLKVGIEEFLTEAYKVAHSEEFDVPIAVDLQ